MNVKKFKLWTALVTPFNEDLTVDYVSLRWLLKEQCEAQNGLLLLGSTGEGLNIDLDTKKSIIRFAQNEKLNVPIMIAVGGHQFEATLKWVRWLETQSVDAYLMVTPMYAKPGDTGQYQWFKRLMDEVTRPVMLYNAPGRTGKELSYKAVNMLSKHTNFWAIKESSGSVSKFKEYLKAANGSPVYCGDDGLMPDFATAGCTGLISVASNTWPKETHLYLSQCLDQNLNAKELWAMAADSLFIESNPIPVKRILKNEGRIRSDVLMPPLSRNDLQNDSKLNIATHSVKDWFSKNN